MHVVAVTKAISKFSQLAADQHTLVDTLGRNVLVECIAAHFLNPYIKSPITVSISGGSGTGKSSLMYQIEAYLLITAAQLAFPYLWENEDFNGARKISLTIKGVQMCKKIEKGVYTLLGNRNYRNFKEDVVHLSPQQRPTMSLVYLLREYLPKCKAVYKSLACMDVAQLMEEGEKSSVHEIEGQSLGAIPRILTVNFNAGNYRGRTEAWAGLAIEITKEIEASMTWAQLLSTRWRNMWIRHGQDFYLRFIFPGVLLVFVGAWIGWAAWKLLDREGPSELKDLKYGSVTATVIVIVWSILGKIVSVLQPISSQMSGYFSLPDHSQQLGYQQKVIADIQFLKEEIGRKPCFIFSFIAGEMCKNWWGLWKENVQGTCIPRYGSAPEGKLRIIAFVDDLDQCEETVILPMLWAINLVFKVCEINVILTMDKATIETAYRKSSLVQDNDFADKFISKIVQLPVNIPDPTDDEWLEFLDTAMLRNRKVESQQTTGRVETLPINEQSRINGGNRGEPEKVRGPKDIESGKSSIKWEGCCIPFLTDWPVPWLKGITSCFLSFIHGILHFLGFVVCNIREENERHQPDYSDDSESFPDGTKILFQRLQQVRESWMLSYNDEEAEAFHQLKCYATGSQKVPREWKCYITYHNFAKNIVSKMGKGKKFPVGWEVEFMVWTFVCLQWKHEINVLIQDWYKYAYVKESDRPAILKTSLKKIVADYIAQRNWGEQTG
ncbi:uncharacterized protein LOC131067605 [Cryptomeria japonica]|uniref:uncharacterized protein LOC131067605 n=1 Tax=Cryptomeria japonica TaxID=3369 RepID=UPI0027DA94E3|nr:uncharacterized protein LOC131067605 [Cryptomeria japonica]